LHRYTWRANTWLVNLLYRNVPNHHEEDTFSTYDFLWQSKAHGATPDGAAFADVDCASDLWLHLSTPGATALPSASAAICASITSGDDSCQASGGNPGNDQGPDSL
jgi:hypothetical protein